MIDSHSLLQDGRKLVVTSTLLLALIFMPSVIGVSYDVLYVNDTYVNDSLTIGTNVRTVSAGSAPVVIQGNYTGSIVTGTMDFNPRFYGSGTYAVAYGRPRIYSSLNDLVMFYFTPSYFNNVPQYATGMFMAMPAHQTNVNDYYRAIYHSGETRSFLSFSGTDASTVNYNWITLGAPTSMGNIGAGVPASFSENMITLKGGLSRLVGTASSMNQVGINFTGFGTTTGLANDRIKGIVSDGGQFDFLGSSYVNTTSLQSNNYYAGSGSQGITQDFNISGLILSFEDGLLVGTSGVYNGSTGSSSSTLILDETEDNANDFSILGWLGIG